MLRNKQRSKGSGDVSEENLRGKLRELEKQIETQKRHIKSLEKQLKRSVDPEKFEPEMKRVKKSAKEENDKANSCPKCNSPAYGEAKLWSPSGEIIWLICQTCKHKEKKKSDS